MEKISSSKELMDHISKMNRDHSIYQFFIPGKGRFTLVLQEEDIPSIGAEIESNPELKKMIQESREEYKHGLGFSTPEFLKLLSPEDLCNESSKYLMDPKCKKQNDPIPEQPINSRRNSGLY